MSTEGFFSYKCMEYCFIIFYVVLKEVHFLISPSSSNALLHFSVGLKKRKALSWILFSRRWGGIRVLGGTEIHTVPWAPHWVSQSLVRVYQEKFKVVIKRKKNQSHQKHFMWIDWFPEMQCVKIFYFINLTVENLCTERVGEELTYELCIIQ